MNLSVNAAPVTPPIKSVQGKRIRMFIYSGILTLFVAWLVMLYLRPLYYNINLSLSSASSEAGQPDYPSSVRTFSHQGQALELYNVPTKTDRKSVV